MKNQLSTPVNCNIIRRLELYFGIRRFNRMWKERIRKTHKTNIINIKVNKKSKSIQPKHQISTRTHSNHKQI